MKKKKQKKWLKFRHRAVRNILFAILRPYTRWKYGFFPERFKDQKKGAYLILFNHQTPFDQFFVGMSFKKPVYYLASEDLFSNGWVSSLIRLLVAPIPIRKQTTDTHAVMTCLRVAREGGTIAIAPEGNRTYSGKTEFMNPAIAPLAKKLGLPIALYRIEGGYGVVPRWSDVLRKGKMRSYVSRVIEPEEYSKLSNQELYDIIRQELYINESVDGEVYNSQKRAEYLERAIYVCPKCGFSTFESNKNAITCKKCGLNVEYGANKFLSSTDSSFPFATVNQWYEYQQDFVNATDVIALTEAPLYNEQAAMSEVILFKKKVLLIKSANLRLYGNRITVNEGADNSLEFPFDTVSAVTVLGRNKLNVYFGDKVYQFKGSRRFNALKYVNLYFRYKNIVKGDEDAEFLGL